MGVLMKFISLELQKIIGSTYSNLRLLYLDKKLPFFNKSNQIKKIAKKDFFIHRIFFEVSNICNAKCCFCAYKYIMHNKDHKSGFMKFDVFRKALDDYIKMKGKSISFTATIGDTLLDPGLFDKIKYAVSTKKIKYMYFYTNGVGLLKNDAYKKIVDSGINTLEISTADFEKKNWERIYGVKAYDTLLKGMSLLLKYAKKKESKINIAINFRTNKHPLRIYLQKDFRKYIKPYLTDKVDLTYMTTFDNWGGSIKRLPRGMVFRHKMVNQQLTCARTFDLAVLFDGSVRLCACRAKDTEFDSLVVGNVNSDSLKNIYYSEEAQKIRFDFMNGKLAKVCKNCSFYSPMK